MPTQTEPCAGCTKLSSENLRLRNLWLGAKHKLEMERNEKARLETILGNKLFSCYTLHGHCGSSAISQDDKSISVL